MDLSGGSSRGFRGTIKRKVHQGRRKVCDNDCLIVLVLPRELKSSPPLRAIYLLPLSVFWYPDCRAKVTYPNGDTFEGAFNDNKKKHGRGIYTWSTASGANPWVPEGGYPGEF